jgi:tetratricopeptide (TPR) repeat protein
MGLEKEISRGKENRNMKNLFKTKLLFIATLVVFTTAAWSQTGECAADDYGCKVGAYSKQIQADPKDAESYYSRAVAFRHLKQYEQAIADATKYIASNPKKKEYLADGYGERGLSYYASGSDLKALADFNMAIQLAPSATYYINRGNYYLKNNLPVKAVADYNQAIALDVKAVEAYYNRARAYRIQKLYSKAIADLDVYITLNKADVPFLADGYQNRSLNYSDMNDINQALKDINSAIELDGSVAQRFRNRAGIYRKMGKLDLAEADERAAAELK